MIPIKREPDKTGNEDDEQRKRGRIENENNEVQDSLTPQKQVEDIMITTMQNFPNEAVKRSINMIHHQKYQDITVREFLKLNPASEMEDSDGKIILDYIQNLVRRHLPKDANISGLLTEKTFYVFGNRDEDYDRLSFDPNVGSFESPSADYDNVPLAQVLNKGLFHKTLVVSGESGAGKSTSAVKRFPQLIIESDMYSNTYLFHLSTITSKIKVKTFDVNDESRNATAIKLLRDMWSDGLNQLESFLLQQTGWNENLWKSINIVMIIDELGPFPNLLRGLINMAPEMENEAILKVKRFRLICVGTGVDWSVSEEDALNPALSQTLHEKFHHVRMTEWCQEDKRKFLESARSQGNSQYEECYRIRLNDAVIQMRFTNCLLGNARCATLLAKYLKNIRVTADPEHTVYLHRALILRDVAAHYESLNGGISRLFDQNGLNASKMLYELLTTLENNPTITQENVVSLRKFVVIGLLIYHKDNAGIEKVSMSPAILLLVLTNFGRNDFAVLNGEDFKHLVALRELSKIYAVSPDANVKIVVLNEPFPPIKSNSELKKETTEDTPIRKCTFTLPRSHFHWEASNSTFLPNVDNAWHIIVNGPNAPAAEVIVLPPLNNSCQPVRVIHAKQYSDESQYESNPINVHRQISKFGLNENSYPATYCALQTLLSAYGSNEKQYVFVLNSYGTQLLTQLQEISHEIADIAMQQPSLAVDVGKVIIHVEQKNCHVYVEEISETWKQLVPKTTPELPTVDVEILLQKDNNMFFGKVNQYEQSDDDGVDDVDNVNEQKIAE